MPKTKWRFVLVATASLVVASANLKAGAQTGATAESCVAAAMHVERLSNGPAVTASPCNAAINQRLAAALGEPQPAPSGAVASPMPTKSRNPRSSMSSMSTDAKKACPPNTTFVKGYTTKDGTKMPGSCRKALPKK